MTTHRYKGYVWLLAVAMFLTLLGSAVIAQDFDEDGLEDTWEVFWFGSIDHYGAADDPDRDGLSNIVEFGIDPSTSPNSLSPANWDTDGDGFDDGWEYVYGTLYDTSHLDPTNISSHTMDFDGDGLSTWQEYCGVDGHPRLVYGGHASGGVVYGTPKGVRDDLNPLDVDSDFDMLIDSFEAAWYDPANNIDPINGLVTKIPENNAVDTAIARADSDKDGLSNYREQCLLMEFREGEANADKWMWNDRVPFPFISYTYNLDQYTNTIRVARMSFSGVDLDLGLNMNQPIPVLANRNELRNEEWTDPTDGTGYTYIDENIPPGHDTDNDTLPDGWEVQFSLDPRDDGLSALSWTNGPWGDPDNDGISNYNEYLGQDGNRFTTLPFINGTGDETNPYHYPWRPDSTYTWRWLPTNAPLSFLTSPHPGTALNRGETLGSANPSAPLTSGVSTYNSTGFDLGTDSDDDGISDSDEIESTLLGGRPSSPVHSCDPFLPKSILITDTAGIPIPDPEPASAARWKPAGLREDLQGRDWTIECQVKLLADGLSGDLFNFTTALGPSSRIIYRLSLSNNIPVLVAQNNSATAIYTMSTEALPTNEWVHIAGTWDHQKNNLSLYIHGILQQGQNVLGESASSFYMPSTNILALAVSPDGSFVNNLMLDEVRIWGLSRSSTLLHKYSKLLIPQNTGDDVWLSNSGTTANSNDMVLVNGGSLFEGEPGVPLENVYNFDGSYWIDDGDAIYNQINDILLYRNWESLKEGVVGEITDGVLYNDKDESGDYSDKSLLAYYRFDDGGETAEDFARKAKRGQVGVTSENYTFGDRGYALTTNNFQWITTDASPVRGVDVLGADDTDKDGMSDAWEMMCHLNPYDNGTGNETAPGKADGPYGPLGDPDNDGLINIYEFHAQTNPQEFDSDSDSVSDASEDYDGDGVVNITEQLLGSRPDMVDTDDDGKTDSVEQGAKTDPANAINPPISRSIALGGTADDYLEVPSAIEQRLNNWTLEAWVHPDAISASDQIVLRRVLQDLGNGTNAVNFVMGLTPNAGNLTLYAGYIGVDGTRYIIENGTVTVGTWTHIAATYDNSVATLIIYTNGVECASINNLYLAPPVNGKGGDTFLRIGESFDGMIDDLRIWRTVRTQAEIEENRHTAILELGDMVNYFRFDDGEANEDSLPFSEFHQPHGSQDFTVEKDWETLWAHAAIHHGNVAFSTDSPIFPPSSLQIILEPDGAVYDGAKWSVDGGSWNDSGGTVYWPTGGDHQITYKSVVGWDTPLGETITVSNSTAVTITRSYRSNGALTVSLEPSAAVEDGATWRLGSGDWQETDTTVTNIPPGTYTVGYKIINGWEIPTSEPVTIVAGETNSIVRTYSRKYGAVTVNINPLDAVNDGAQWRIDSGAWQDSGTVVSNLDYGEHTVEFSDLPLWNPPGTIAVTVDSSSLQTVAAKYAQATGLFVELTPSSVTSLGAVWRINSGSWQTSETLVELAPGSYTVEFGEVNGWAEPAPLTTVVTNDITTRITAAYYPVREIGAYGTNAPGLLRYPRGISFGPSGRLYIADTDNHCIQVYNPNTDAWETRIGSFGTNAGEFNQPMDVHVDAAGNIYVADAKNHRIQKRDAGSGTWIVWGGTAAGTAPGEFNGPFGIVSDAAGNIYVAEQYNHRVQKLTAGGGWSTIIANGFNNNQTRFPRDLLMTAGGNLLLADFNAGSGETRVREFTTAGAYVQTLGSSNTTQGSLNKVGNMAVNAAGDLFVTDMGINQVRKTAMTPIDWSVILGATHLNSPEGIAYSATHGLFISDTANHRLLQIDLTAASSGGSSSAVALSINIIPMPVSDTGAPMPLMSTEPRPRAIEISWPSQTNFNYSVEERRGVNSDWSTIPGAGSIQGEPGKSSFVDTNTAAKVKIYRIIKN